jgi:methyl-accepting chemotaxis protein
MNEPIKRRIVLIDTRFQLRMAASFIFLHVILTGLFVMGLYVFVDSELHAELASAHASYQSLKQILMPLMIVLASFSIVLSSVLAAIFVILISHKIAGPMYRFRVVLQSLAHRRFEVLTRIRPEDQLGELANSLEQALSVVQEDVKTLQNLAVKLRLAHENNNRDTLSSELSAMENLLGSWGKK